MCTAKELRIKFSALTCFFIGTLKHFGTSTGSHMFSYVKGHVSHLELIELVLVNRT